MIWIRCDHFKYNDGYEEKLAFIKCQLFISHNNENELLIMM